MRDKYVVYFFVIFLLLCFRILLGVQVNFSHEDYFQIYAIGLKALINNDWPFWGPRAKSPQVKRRLLAFGAKAN